MKYCETKEQFIDYCRDKINELGYIKHEYYDEIVKSPIAMIGDIKEVEDALVVLPEGSDWESLTVVDQDGKMAYDTPMLGPVEYAFRLEFKEIDEEFYNTVLDYWDEYSEVYCNESCKVNKSNTMNIKEELNKLDLKSIDEGTTFYDLRGLYEATKMTMDDKQDMKALLNSTDDPEVIGTYLIAKYNKQESKNEDIENPVISWREEEDNERFPSHRYERINQKQVKDSDGFWTDYTEYYDTVEDRYVFVFGDSDMYSPEDEWFDWECDTKEEAEEWFDNYSGDEGADELFDEAVGGKRNYKITHRNNLGDKTFVNYQYMSDDEVRKLRNYIRDYNISADVDEVEEALLNGKPEEEQDEEHKNFFDNESLDEDKARRKKQQKWINRKMKNLAREAERNAQAEEEKGRRNAPSYKSEAEKKAERAHKVSDERQKEINRAHDEDVKYLELCKKNLENAKQSGIQTNIDYWTKALQQAQYFVDNPMDESKKCKDCKCDDKSLEETVDPNRPIYYVSLSDYPYDPLKVNANSEREAERIAQEYIRKWNLDAYVEKVYKDKPEWVKESLDEAWNTFIFDSGSNPYIAKTPQETRRLLRKYDGIVDQVGDKEFHVHDVEKTSKRWNENLNESEEDKPYTYSQMAQELDWDLKNNKSGNFAVYYPEEKEICKKILRRKGFEFEVSETKDNWYHFEYWKNSGKKEEALDDTEEKPYDENQAAKYGKAIGSTIGAGIGATVGAGIPVVDDIALGVLGGNIGAVGGRHLYRRNQRKNNQAQAIGEDYTENKEDWGTPFTEDELEAELSELTNNYQEKSGAIRTMEDEYKVKAVSILKKMYKVVEVSDGRTQAGEPMSWVIAYSHPKQTEK